MRRTVIDRDGSLQLGEAARCIGAPFSTDEKAEDEVTSDPSSNQ